MDRDVSVRKNKAELKKINDLDQMWRTMSCSQTYYSLFFI